MKRDRTTTDCTGCDLFGRMRWLCGKAADWSGADGVGREMAMDPAAGTARAHGLTRRPTIMTGIMEI